MTNVLVSNTMRLDELKAAAEGLTDASRNRGDLLQGFVVLPGQKGGGGVGLGFRVQGFKLV